MPRRARIRIPQVPWHVVHRGHNQDPCFFGPADYAYYLDQLTLLSSLHGCAVHAYALMTNHVHLLLTPVERDGVSLMMKNLAQAVSRRTNKARNRSGALWEGRFRSSVVDTSAYLFSCYRYIELNPVRAGMVASPRDYSWSSYRCNAEGRFSPAVRPHEQYLALGDTDEARRAAYRELFGEPLPPGELAFIRNRSRCGFVIGGPSFEHDVAQRAGVVAGPVRRHRQSSVP